MNEKWKEGNDTMVKGMTLLILLDMVRITV